MDDIEAKVIGIVRKKLGVKDQTQITRETNFINDLGADSLDTVELFMEFEEVFQLKDVADSDAEKIKTVGEAVDFIKEKQQQSA